MKKTVTAVINQAEQHCSMLGQKLTEKRSLILAELVQSDKALSAYELAEAYYQHGGKKIPVMSVYRILDFLADYQLVHKLNLANKYVACAHICCNHEHEIQQFLICDQCSYVKEINIDKSTIKAIQQTVNNADFVMTSSQLEINCICNSCSKNIN